MIGHRDGHTVTICDGCYRPRRRVLVKGANTRTGCEHVPEPGWEHSDEGGYPEATAVEQIVGSGNTATRTREVVQPEQGLDYCPRCVAERRGVGSTPEPLDQFNGWGPVA